MYKLRFTSLYTQSTHYNSTTVYIIFRLTLPYTPLISVIRGWEKCTNATILLWLFRISNRTCNSSTKASSIKQKKIATRNNCIIWNKCHQVDFGFCLGCWWLHVCRFPLFCCSDDPIVLVYSVNLHRSREGELQKNGAMNEQKLFYKF